MPRTAPETPPVSRSCEESARGVGLRLHSSARVFVRGGLWIVDVRVVVLSGVELEGPRRARGGRCAEARLRPERGGGLAGRVAGQAAVELEGVEVAGVHAGAGVQRGPVERPAHRRAGDLAPKVGPDGPAGAADRLAGLVKDRLAVAALGFGGGAPQGAFALVFHCAPCIVQAVPPGVPSTLPVRPRASPAACSPA